ncbi:MAG: pyridoxamine 5'-phosphate oxidase family protein [Actinomycetota bacterium]|nr:pyridoxamine 5'-phosphate oxidase family protein [Actinomycetota bacterium]
MSRRDQITMSPEEIRAFLDEQRVVICATNGHNGWPHLMPLWFVTRDEEIWAWTYGKSQKVRNLERDSRATLQVEDGEQYDQLRGLMIEAQTVVHRDTELVLDFGLELFARYNGGGQGAEFRDAIRAQAAKRVALQFKTERIASFDHRKLAGVY